MNLFYDIGIAALLKVKKREKNCDNCFKKLSDMLRLKIY